MFFTRVFIGMFEFMLAVAMSGFVIALTYRVFITANPDFDMEGEIVKGNVAVGTLVGAILFAASMILLKGMSSVASMVRLRMAVPSAADYSVWRLFLMSLGHLAASMMLAMMTVSFTLRLFGRMVKGWKPGEELKKGNMAVGILLSTVVLIAAIFVGEGVSSLSKALVPQPSIGRVQILR